MSALPTQTYCVTYKTWDEYLIEIEAGSEEEALAKAEALYQTTPEAFSREHYKDTGFQIDDITYEVLA